MFYHAKYTPPQPPSLQETQRYFTEKGASTQAAELFFKYYQKKKWRARKGRPLRNWKAAAYQWMSGPAKNKVGNKEKRPPVQA